MKNNSGFFSSLVRKQRKHKQLHFILLEASLSFIQWTLFCHRNHLLKQISHRQLSSCIPYQTNWTSSLFSAYSVVTCCSFSWALIITAMIHLHHDQYRHKKSLGYKRWECRMSYTHIYASKTEVGCDDDEASSQHWSRNSYLVQFVQSNRQWNVSLTTSSLLLLSWHLICRLFTCFCFGGHHIVFSQPFSQPKEAKELQV